MSRGLTISLVWFALACAAPRKESTPPDLAVVRAELDSLWARYSTAAVAGDPDGIARLYADSAYLVESGLPTVRGNVALRSIVQEVLGGLRFLESSVRPELTELAGDRVLQFGTYRDVLQPTGQSAHVVVGRFAAVFQRDSTAAWRVSRLIAVADSTVPQAAKPQ